MKNTAKFDVRVKPQFIPSQSDPSQNRYVFAYTVTIENTGDIAAKLLTRHWIITNAEGHTEEVKGPGVIGQHPHLQPGEIFEYTSGSVLETPIGTMQGSYQMRSDDGLEFDAQIPVFSLTAVQLH